MYSDPPQTLGESATQQESSNPQKDVSIQLLEQQQQIINLLSNLVDIHCGQKTASLQQQTIPQKV